MAQDAYLTDQALLAQNPELQDLSRQRKLAEMLTSKAFEQPQGALVSGHYVAPSWTQQLAPLVSGIAGQAMGENLDKKQLAMIEALRTQKVEEQKAIMDAINSGDTKKALALASQAKYGGKEFVAPLLGNVIPKAPEATTLEREFKAAQADPINPFKGSFSDFRNQMTDYQKIEAKNSAARLAIEQTKANQEKVNPQEAGLRSSFLNQAQPHIQISQAYRKIESAPDTAAGDMSKIFGFMKILDPGSTVREGEYASAENARGVPDTVKAQYNKVISGQRLSPAQRTQFTQAAGDLINSQKQQFGEVAKYYSDISNRYQINPENIVYDPYKDLNVQTTPPKAPKQQINAAQQLGVPQANNGWNIINVTPSR